MMGIMNMVDMMEVIIIVMEDTKGLTNDESYYLSSDRLGELLGLSYGRR